jgi:hypothetical protein
MSKLSSILLLAALLGAAVAFGMHVKAQQAAETQEGAPTRVDWSRLKVVTYASGLTGFFDPDDGKLYIYDSSLDRCYMTRQLTALGEPLMKIKSAEPAPKAPPK